MYSVKYEYGTAALPTDVNNVRYAGAYLETFADAGNSLDAIYLCGERHYWPAYGRFLQRDSLCYRKMPNSMVPLNVNPYIYAQNNPVMQKDLTGLASTWVRGCHRGGRTLRLGGNYPSDPSQVDCDNIPEISPDDAMDGLHILQAPMGKPGLGGMLSARDALNVIGREADLCKLDHRNDPQPKNACAQITYVSAELCCHYLDKCAGDTDNPGGSGPGNGDLGGNQDGWIWGDDEGYGGGGGCVTPPGGASGIPDPNNIPGSTPPDPLSGGGGGGGGDDGGIPTPILDCIDRFEADPGDPPHRFPFHWEDDQFGTGLEIDTIYHKSMCCYYWKWNATSLTRAIINALFTVIFGPDVSGITYAQASLILEDWVTSLGTHCYNYSEDPYEYIP